MYYAISLHNMIVEIDKIASLTLNSELEWYKNS